MPSFLGRIVMFSDNNQAFCMANATRWHWHPWLAVTWQTSRTPSPRHLGMAGEWLQLLLPKFAMGSSVDFPDVSFSFLSWGCSQCVVVLTLRPPKTLGSLSHFFPGDFLWKMSKSIHRTSAANTTIWMGWGQCTLHSTSLNTTVDLKHYEYKWI